MAAPSYGSLVNSLNIYVDTFRDLGPGDDVNIQLQNNSISAQDGMHFKLSLTEFNMYRNFYTVNNNNNKIRLTTGAGATPIELDVKNYKTMGEIALEFATKLATQLAADTAVAISTTVALPTTGKILGEKGDRKLSMTFTFASNHNLSVCRLQCFTDVGESFALLGGDRVDDATSTDSSFSIDFSTDPTKVVVTGLYPMQRSTESHVFVRTDLRNNNIETSSLSSATGPWETHTLTSNILAKIPINVEFASMVQVGPYDEFFVYLPQKSLSSLRLFLTDSKGRPLGRIANSTSKTAAGSGTAQSTKGNLHFSATLRLDIIQKQHPNTIRTKPEPRTIPGRFTGALLTQDFGAPK